MEEAIKQFLLVNNIKIFPQPCNIAHLKHTSNLVCTDGTRSAETDGTLTSTTSAASEKLEDFRVETEHEVGVEHVAFLTVVLADAASVVSLQLADVTGAIVLKKKNG